MNDFAFKPAAPKGTAQVEPTEGKPPRKKRTVKPRSVKLELASAVAALGGLKETDIETLEGLIALLQPLAPKARSRVVAALAKVFE